MEHLRRFTDAELIGHDVCEFVRRVIEDDLPGMQLDRCELYVLKQLLKDIKLIRGGDYLDIVVEDGNLRGWSGPEREECMRKVQNIGLVAIITGEKRGRPKGVEGYGKLSGLGNGGQVGVSAGPS